MQLTDPAVQYWSCVVAILATVAVLMLWNRVRGPRIVKGLSRFGLLLGGYVATAVAVLVSVNIAYGGLVVSVDDLFADINPPMGQYMHHHQQCGGGHGALAGGAPSQAAAPAASLAPADDAQQPPDDGTGRPVDAGPWARPCPQSSDSAAASPARGTAAAADAGGAQAATRSDDQDQDQPQVQR